MSSISELERTLTSNGGPFGLAEGVSEGRRFLVFKYRPHTLIDLYQKGRQVGRQVLLEVNGESFTYAEVFGAALRLAGGLSNKLNIRMGVRVGIAIGDSLEVVVALIAVTAVGAVAVLIGESTPESQAINAELGKCEFLIRRENNAVIIEPLFGSIAELCPLNTLISGSENFDLSGNIHPDAEALVAFTSGTTGLPKGVILTHRNIVTGLKNTLLAASLSNSIIDTPTPSYPISRKQRCTHLAAPLSHISGFGQLLLQIMLGGKLSLCSNFSVEKMVDAILENQPHSIVGLTHEMIWSLLKLAPTKLQCLSSIHVSGAAVHQNLVAEIRRSLPQISVSTSYGMTEISGAICALSGRSLVDRKFSSGRVVPTAYLKIVDESGTEVPPGREGEIWLRGAMLMKAYCNHPAMGDGWFATNDLGTLSEDRYLTITGRKRDVIRVNGCAISRLAVERFISDKTGSNEVAVLFQNEDAQIGLIACITSQSNKIYNVNVLQQTISKEFNVHARLEITSMLPHTPSGKIDYVKLKRQIR
jgi:long-chain acyl-CoA synthetase